MRSERGLSTILHCLQWYKLLYGVLAYPLQQCSIVYRNRTVREHVNCGCPLVGECEQLPQCDQSAQDLAARAAEQADVLFPTVVEAFRVGLQSVVR